LCFFTKQNGAGFTVQLNNIISRFIVSFLHESRYLVVVHKL
jgi:hypothetical protein